MTDQTALYIYIALGVTIVVVLILLDILSKRRRESEALQARPKLSRESYSIYEKH